MLNSVISCNKHTSHLFENPLCSSQSLIRRIVNIAFHILTLGIPFIFYHVVSYCIVRAKSLLVGIGCSSVIPHVSDKEEHLLIQDLKEFAEQKLLENPNQELFEWHSEISRHTQGTRYCPRFLNVVPENQNISKLVGLYHNNLQAFHKLIVIEDDGRDPWLDKDVLIKANEIFKLSCSIALLTIEDIKKNVMLQKAIKSRLEGKPSDVLQGMELYTSRTMYYFWFTYTSLRMRATRKGIFGSLWNFPRDIYANSQLHDSGYRCYSFKESFSKQMSDGLNEKYRVEWQKLYNVCCNEIHRFCKQQRIDIKYVPSFDVDEHDFLGGFSADMNVDR